MPADMIKLYSYIAMSIYIYAFIYIYMRVYVLICMHYRIHSLFGGDFNLAVLRFLSVRQI